MNKIGIGLTRSLVTMGLAVLAMVALLATGCGGSTAETLGSILGRGAGVSSVKYDMITMKYGVVTTPLTEPETTTVWVKNNKIRMDTLQTPEFWEWLDVEPVMILIDTDAKTEYTCYLYQNTAYKTVFDPARIQSAGQATQLLLSYNPTTIGADTVDGKACVVVEYTYQGATIKEWIWKDRGFPLRMEITEGPVRTVIEYKNISFIDIPDSTFQFPTGIIFMNT